MHPKRFLVSHDNTLRWLQHVVFSAAILYFARSIFIPLSFALLIAFVLYPVTRWLEGKGLRRLTAIIITLSGLMLAGMALVSLFVYQVLAFSEEWPLVQEKVTDLLSSVASQIFKVTGKALNANELLSKQIWLERILNVLSQTASASAWSMLMLFLIPVYSILILYYRHHWVAILGRLFPEENRESITGMVVQTIETYYRFIKGMAIVYMVVGSLNSVGLLLLGVPHAILFGFVASVLTFIPYVGIIVGSLLPITMAWITYDSIWYPVGVIAIFTFVQYLEANIIFPVAVSSRLKVNTLIMLLAIFVGGLLWGMAGMILFVPFVGIAKLIADHNPRWRTLSMILGESQIDK